MTTEKFKPKMKDWVQKTAVWSGEGLKEWDLSLKEVQYLFETMNKERDDLSDINFIFKIEWLKKVIDL